MSFGSTMSFDFSDLYDIYLTYILDFGWTCSELESAIKISRLSRSTHFRTFLGLLLKPRSHLSNLLYERGSETKLGSLEWGLKRLKNMGNLDTGRRRRGGAVSRSWNHAMVYHASPFVCGLSYSMRSLWKTLAFCANVVQSLTRITC